MSTHFQVIFFSVRETAAKLLLLCKTAAEHFNKKEPLQIIVPDRAALEFVDALLWRLPEESFLPHSCASMPTSELLVITSERTILNGAQHLFNLCTTPPLNSKVKLIYDFDDLTSPEKKQASDKRYQAYREAGFQISSK